MRPKFTMRALLVATAAISIGFVAPLEPLVYLVNIIFFTWIISLPILALWLAFTPDAHWRKSLASTFCFLHYSIATFAILIAVVVVRMQVMGQNF